MIAERLLAPGEYTTTPRSKALLLWAHTRSWESGPRCGDRILSDELADGKLVVALVHIAGHGRACAPPAELLANDVLVLLYFGHSPGEAVRIADRDLARELRIDGPQFATLFAARIEPKQRRIVYVCAGYEGALIVEPDGTPRRLERSGPVLGVLVQPDFAERYAIFDSPSELVVVTDGVIDSRNALGERSGSTESSPPLAPSRGSIRLADDASALVVSL